MKTSNRQSTPGRQHPLLYSTCLIALILRNMGCGGAKIGKSLHVYAEISSNTYHGAEHEVSNLREQACTA
jgi:hypothetical protein